MAVLLVIHPAAPQQRSREAFVDTARLPDDCGYVLLPKG
jgi:hypothetical protein